MVGTYYKNHLQVIPVLRCFKQAGAKLAKQLGKACRARFDVALSGAFNALCPHIELGMIALFAI